jgi:hypothetical protein
MNAAIDLVSGVVAILLCIIANVLYWKYTRRGGPP